MNLNRLIPLLILLMIIGTPTAAQTPERPMVMPVAGEAGPGNWLFGQAYGNTTGAYNFGSQWYEAGQGLHFGIDLSLPCGTPLVAVADGTVQFVDDRGFGSMPHNLIMRHGDLGLTTLYGHLLDTPPVAPGQFVQQGEIIGYSGDPDDTCSSRPHLHFEVRSLDYSRTINPVDVIDANWHSLATIGPFGYPLFQQDLNNPRRWMSMEDQPDVRFWGAILNNYTATYPAANGRRPADSPTPSRDLQPPSAPFTARQLTQGGCCANAEWDTSDPSRFYVMDGQPGSVAGVYAWSADAPENGGTLLRPAPLRYQSPYGVYWLEPFINGFTRISSNDTERTVDTDSRIPTINPANTALLWTDEDGDSVPGQQRPLTRVKISQLDGSNVREIFAAPGANARWLDDDRVLLSVRDENRRTSVSVYRLSTNETREVGEWREMRGLDASPGGRYIAFYLTWQENPADNGVWLIDTENGDAVVRPGWFGAWRWRDATALYYVPFNPGTSFQSMRLYDAATGDDTALLSPERTPISIANGDWSVSADGTRILYQDARDGNIYVLEPSAS